MAIAKKWIKGLDPNDPVSRAARRAARQRLLDVKFFLPLAAHSKKDAENIHQLRVATRRAVAVLDVYGDLIPRKRGRRIKKLLRHARRAAGDARDLDVLLRRLGESSAANSDLDVASAVKLLKKRRKEVQRPVVEVFEELRASRFDRLARRLVKRVRWREDDEEPTFGEAACRIMTPAIDDFFEAAAADDRNLESLHEMRIRGKALRYAMELLSGAFDKSMRKDVYPQFVALQDELGKVNDHATAEALYRKLRRRSKGKTRKVLRKLAEREATAAEESAKAVRESWSKDRVLGMRKEFDRLLKRPSMPDDESSGDSPDDSNRPDSGPSSNGEGSDANADGNSSDHAHSDEQSRQSPSRESV